MREFVKKTGVRLVEGSISHQHLLENHVVPGMILFGADSHTCMGGAVGAFATGIGSSEMAAVWASGKLWVKVPESIKVNLNGQLNKGVFARDIVSHFIATVGEDGGNYRSIEWKGPAVKDLSIASRACISNNSMEWMQTLHLRGRPDNTGISQVSKSQVNVRDSCRIQG